MSDMRTNDSEMTMTSPADSHGDPPYQQLIECDENRRYDNCTISQHSVCGN
jgi:hypothetical protein